MAKALPDIRTANKVVELVLANASIAVTGIWQAEDDGVLNPATVRLVPGAIIPKAPGSSGLTPLAAPGSFDVSQLVLNDLRARIRTALLADRLGPQRDQRMTATEVLERAAETSRLLGATYGRLQAELLTPLIARCLSILRRRGDIAPLLLDGREAVLRYTLLMAQREGLSQRAIAIGAGIGILASLLGAAISIRQVLLHILPGDPGFGSPMFGYHLYTWAAIAFACNIAAAGMQLLGLQWFSGSAAFRPPMVRLTAMALGVMLVANILSVIAEAGFAWHLPDNPTTYLLFSR